MSWRELTAWMLLMAGLLSLIAKRTDSMTTALVFFYWLSAMIFNHRLDETEK